MKFKYFLLTTLIAIVSCSQLDKSSFEFNEQKISLKQDEEPPLIFEIKSKKGVQYFIENEKAELKGVFENPEIVIEVYDWRLFPHGDVAFEYPRNYTFEADLTITDKIWTLSGNDFKIMLISSIVETGLNEYVNQMISQFGNSNCKTSNISKTFNDKILDGTKLSVNLAGIDIELDVFEIFHDNGNKSFIVFQDALTDSNENSNESKTTYKRIQETLKIN